MISAVDFIFNNYISDLNKNLNEISIILTNLYNDKNDEFNEVVYFCVYFKLEVFKYLSKEIIEKIKSMEIGKCRKYGEYFFCKRGYINTLKVILSEKDNININRCLELASMFGHLDIVKFLIEEKNGDNLNINVFSNAAFNKHLDIMKYLIQKDINNELNLDQSITMTTLYIENMSDQEEDYEDYEESDQFTIFNQICYQLDLDMIKYLVSIESKYDTTNRNGTVNKFRFSITFLSNLSPLIESNKPEDNLKIYKMLNYLFSLEPTHGFVDIYGDNFSNFNIVINSLILTFLLISLERPNRRIVFNEENNYLYFAACKNVEVMKLLMSMENEERGKIDIHYLNEEVFTYNFDQNNIECITYLLSLENTHGKINIHAKDDSAFWSTLEHKNFKLTKLLISLEDTHGKIDINSNITSLYYLFAKNNIEALDFLFTLENTHGKIDIHKDNDSLFKELCRYSNDPKPLKYLFSLEKTHNEIYIKTIENQLEYSKNRRFKNIEKLLFAKLNNIYTDPMYYKRRELEDLYSSMK